jgi:hypothetical protein
MKHYFNEQINVGEFLFAIGLLIFVMIVVGFMAATHSNSRGAIKMTDTKTPTTGIKLGDYVRYMVADYSPLGKPFTLTIKWVTEADWYNKKTRAMEKCPSLVFEETQAQLKLTSHENCRILARLWGTNADAWLGKRIVICADEMAMGDGEGGKKRSIRILGEGKKVAPKAPASTAGDETLQFGGTIENLRQWAKLNQIDDSAVDAALEETGGVIAEAYARLNVRVAKSANAGAGK